MTFVLPSSDIRDLLIAAGVGVSGQTEDWSIFIGREPSSPNNCFTIYDTAGDTPNAKWLLDYPRFQIRTRGIDYNTAFQKAQAARDALLSLPSQDIGANRYDGVYVVSDTEFLKLDENNRTIFTSQWRIILEPGSGTNRLPL